MKKKWLSLVLALTMALTTFPITALAVDDTEDAPEYTAVLGMDEILTLRVGETKKLDVWALPMTGSDKITDGSFTYSIEKFDDPNLGPDNSECIEIDENGNITAKKVTQGCVWVNAAWEHASYTAQPYQAQVFVISDTDVSLTFSATDMLTKAGNTLPYQPEGYKISELVQEATAENLSSLSSSIQYGAVWNNGSNMMDAWLWTNPLGEKESFKDQTFKDVGDYTVIATYNAEDGYGSESITFKIEKAPQDPICFIGTDDVPLETVNMSFGESLPLTIKGGANDKDGVLTFSKTSGDIEVGGDNNDAYAFRPTTVGTATITASLESPNYETVTATLTVNVTQGTADLQETSAEVPVSYQTAGETHSYNFGGLFSNLNLGTTTYTLESLSNSSPDAADKFVGDSDILENLTASGTTLSYNLKDGLTVADAGKQAHVFITVNSTNYEPFELKLLFTVSDKATQEAPTAEDFTLTFEPVPNDQYNYTATINSKLTGVEYSFDNGATWSNNSQLTLKGGDKVSATIRRAATDTAEASPAAPVKTEAAPLYKAATPTATPNGGTFTGSVTVTLTCGNVSDAVILYTLDGSDPKSSETAQKCASGDSITLTETTTLRAYAVGGNVTDGSSDDILWQDSDELTVTFTKVSGGGTSGSTPSTPSTPDEETPDQPGTSGPGESGQPSAEVEPTVEGDKASADVDSSTMEKLVEQAGSSDSVTVAVKAPDDVAEVAVSLPASSVADLAEKTDAALNIETTVAAVTLPNESLAELSSGAQSVSITAARDENNTVTITVAKDGETVNQISGGLKAAIPAEETTAGTVAVLVNPDGTETIIKKSIAADGTVTLPLDGSATVKFVDNSKYFEDTQDHWAKDSIDFVSSHDLFNGTGEGIFSADSSMNRAMLVTVLHRLEDTPAGGSIAFDDVDSDQYYSAAVAWASTSGIVDGTGSGFAPEGDVTREQIAVILFRYADVIGVSTDGQGNVDRFSDSDSVSGWATNAVSWAVGVGIISGTSGNRLDPSGSATRGEVATMLMRFVAYLNQ